MRRSVSSAALVAGVLVTAMAQAAPSEVARAEQLFQDARELVASKRYAEACPLLAESLALDPAVGTQFNLADCYENVGRTATAYRLFLDVARIARAAGKFERERSGRERAEALEPSLPRLELVIEKPSPGEEVRVDGEVAKPGPTPEPLDPGSHEIVASAPGRAAFRATVEAHAGAVTKLVVPELVSTEPTEPARPRAPSPIVAAAPSSGTRGTLVIALGTAGFVGLVAGGVAGAMALGTRGEADRLCPRGSGPIRCATQEGVDRWNLAATEGTASTVAFVVGAAAIAGAAVLWATTPKARTQIGFTPAGVRLEGSF